jgi:O-succinylbenzoate synthase
MNKKAKRRNGKLNKDLMKKDVQITTEVLEVRRDEMKVRTVLIVIREDGLRSSHTEVKWVPHFGHWEGVREAVHNQLATSVEQWVDTGVTDGVLADYELE